MSMCVSRLPDDLPPCHRHDQGHRKVSRDSEGSRWVDRSYTLLLKLLARFDKYIFFIKYTKLLKGQSTRFSSSGPLSNSLKYVWFCFVTISPSYLNFSKSPLCLIHYSVQYTRSQTIWYDLRRRKVKLFGAYTPGSWQTKISVKPLRCPDYQRDSNLWKSF